MEAEREEAERIAAAYNDSRHGSGYDAHAYSPPSGSDYDTQGYSNSFADVFRANEHQYTHEHAQEIQAPYQSIHDFWSNLNNPEYQDSAWKAVEIVDPATGNVMTEFVAADIYDKLVFDGLEEHEKNESCVIQPVYDHYGNHVGSETVCEAQDSSTQDCELVPIIDA